MYILVIRKRKEMYHALRHDCSLLQRSSGSSVSEKRIRSPAYRYPVTEWNISLSIGKNIFFYVIPITPTTNSAITIIATNIVQLAMISILLVRSLRTKRIRRQLSMKEQVWCVAGAERQQNRKITRIITTWAERVGPVDVPNRVSKKQVRKYFFVCLSAHMLFPYAASYEGNCIYMVRRLIWFSCPCIRMYRIRWWLKQASGEFKIMRVFFFIYY